MARALASFSSGRLFLHFDRTFELSIRATFATEDAARQTRTLALASRDRALDHLDELGEILADRFVEIGGPKLEMNFTKWPVSAGDGPVGKVTTALWSPRLERNIGYAWLPIGLAADGTSVRVTTPDGERDATVVPMPFVDPGKQIPKSDPAVVL